mgnify:FL=1|tara:strand:+ start:1480 stop:3210 length:1731 start_codon:yes stop_codon:yes gene_type:complete
MAKTSNQELITRYRKKIDQSRRWRQEEKYDDLWSRMIDMYRGKQYRVDSPEDRLLVNIAFATINVIAPGVSVNYPKITVNARKFEQAANAVVTESIVNYWWRHYDCQKEFRRAVKDMLIVGHGWIKTGYRFVEKDVEHETADEMATAAPESIMESEMIITEDRPFVERISCFDVFVDADATSMSDIRWIAQRIKRPLKEVQKDKRYNTSARNDASPSHYSKWGMDEYKGDIQPRHSGDAEDSYVEIWEYYDINSGKMSVFCDGGDKFLVNPVEIPFSFGHPFVMLSNYDVPDHFYPMGELEAIEPLQQELNQTRTQMMNHRKRFSRKWLYKESAFDADGRSALESDEDNVMVPVISEENINSVVGPMPAIISPPEFYNQSSLISSDIDRVSGVSEYQRGSLPEIRRTATEAGIIQDAANARSADKLAIIEAGIASTARRLVALAQQFMTGEQAVRLVGLDAQQVWLNFDRDYLQGEFDFEVEGGSTQPVNESFRRQMAMQVVDAMAPFVGTGIIDMPKLANYVLQYGFGIKNAASFVLPPPPPQMGMDQAQGPQDMQQGAPQGPPQGMGGGIPGGM